MSNQVQRIVYLLKKFQSGEKFTTEQIVNNLPPELYGVSLRTIQRDLVELQNAEPSLEFSKNDKTVVWQIRRALRKQAKLVRLSANELLSFYILKAHLKTFKGTMIEEEVNHLTEKLNEFAPDEVYSDESLYWDQNVGQYNYFQHDHIIRRIIDFSVKKVWVDVSYNPQGKGEIHKYTVLFRQMFSYSGSLYIVAYIPKHNSNIALTVQYIESAEQNHDFVHKIPPFSFSEWTKNRFGVFYGDLHEVELKINPEYSNYFVNRLWHQSQKFSKTSDGSMLLTMTIPISPDFVSWVLSWSDVITVCKPDELIGKIIENLTNTLKNYTDK